MVARPGYHDVRPVVGTVIKLNHFQHFFVKKNRRLKLLMKVTQEKLPASQIGLEIEITSEMTKQSYEKVIQNLARTVNIPGFRKGRCLARYCYSDWVICG